MEVIYLNQYLTFSNGSQERNTSVDVILATPRESRKFALHRVHSYEKMVIYEKSLTEIALLPVIEHENKHENNTPPNTSKNKITTEVKTRHSEH